MITYAAGYIFDFKADAYVNTVNCVGVMGKGVALAFRNKYPLLLNAYKRVCRDGILTPGSLWWWHAHDGTTICNMATKNHWQDPSQYRWVQSGLSSLSTVLAHMNPMTIVVPPLGCGCGGLDWDTVRPMIANALGEQTRHKIIVLEPS